MVEAVVADRAGRGLRLRSRVGELEELEHRVAAAQHRGLGGAVREAHHAVDHPDAARPAELAHDAEAEEIAVEGGEPREVRGGDRSVVDAAHGRPPRCGSLRSVSGITHRSFVSYIDRTREFYAAQGYEKPYRGRATPRRRSRRCAKPLAQCTLAADHDREPVARGGAGRRRAARRQAGLVGPERARLPSGSSPTTSPGTSRRRTPSDVESFLPIRRLQELRARGAASAASRRASTACRPTTPSAAPSSRTRPRSWRAAARTASTSRCSSRFDPSATRP